MHSRFCIVSDRPEYIHRDDQARPHCATGPYTRWRDGWALYYVHGVRVPAWVIEHPEQITAEKIRTESNAELRRVMVERMGLARFMADAGAEQIHEDEIGALYRLRYQDGEEEVAVRVTNSTPEPDGTTRIYWLRVHPELRPLRQTAQGIVAGEPQALTARNAVASTFGLRGEQYRPARMS